jgi:hypothetical protein
VTLSVIANGQKVGDFAIERPGLFVVEPDLPDAPEYRIDISASPVWSAPGDARELSVNLSMIRLTGITN